MPSMAKAERPIRLGLFGISSGAGGLAGESALFATRLWAEEVNEKGGLLGRKIEVIQRDTQNKPEEAVRFAREFAASGDIDFIFAHGSTSEAYAVTSVSKEIKRIMIITPHATDITADPKVRSPYCFRVARNVLHDRMVSGKYAGQISKELRLTKWYTIAPDYSYGRDSIQLHLEFLKKFNPKVEVVGQAWPKLFESDFVPQVTAILRANPDAVYSALWGGDLVNFVKQGSMYGIFNKSRFFFGDLTDRPVIEPIIKALGKFPAGLYAETRCLRTYPDTQANHKFHDTHLKKFGVHPTNWTWQIYIGALLLEEAVRKTRRPQRMMR